MPRGHMMADVFSVCVCVCVVDVQMSLSSVQCLLMQCIDLPIQGFSPDMFLLLLMAADENRIQ